MSDDSREFHRPVKRDAATLDRFFGAADPAERSRLAHQTAAALLARVRDDPEEQVLARLLGFADAHGLDDLAELWAEAPPRSLPGVLWRLYLVQRMIHDDADTAALLYEQGSRTLASIDPVVAGAPVPASPDELVALIDTIMRGVFTGDLGVALDRAAAFCRVTAHGATQLAGDYDASEPARAGAFTRRAARLSDYGADLSASATLWRRGELR